VKEAKLKMIQAEIAAERAAALGRSGARLRAALDALRDFGAASGAGQRRRRLVFEAADACLAYVIHRESLGSALQDVQRIRRDYEVPAEVWNCMGAVDCTDSHGADV
jgi:hypothetical protein